MIRDTEGTRGRAGQIGSGQLLSAAAGERELPELTLLEGFVETVIAPSFKFLATVAIAFSPALVYVIYAVYAGREFQEDLVFLVLSGAGVFLWPMVVLIVGLGGVSSFARPDLILVTLARTFTPYFVTCLLAAGAFAGTWWIGQQTFTMRRGGSHPIALLAGLQVLELYAWVLVMRFIGLYYHHFKGRFAWSWG